MKELSEMTESELENVIQQAQEILFNKKEEHVFYASGKAMKGTSYKQIELFKKLGGIVETSASQIMKRLEMSDMSEAIELAKQGKKVIIR